MLINKIFSKRENLPWILLIAVIPVLLLCNILFTDEVIRASDIVTQYYWGVVDYPTSRFPWPFLHPWQADLNFGTDGTNGSVIHYLPWRILNYLIFPIPASIAWEMALHLIFAGIGTFLYCRVIGLNRYSSFLAAIFFILSSELITLINAGHVGKIATITWIPWVFLALEKGFQERRPFYFLLAGGALALQFFQMHWQISFYSCLAAGLYSIFKIVNIYLRDKNLKEGGKLITYTVLMVTIFLATASISFLPVYEWSKTTERAGGMATQEGMSWSMPPEEVVTYLIPDFFGLSRQESGPPDPYIDIHYWGRMIFTQTTDYLGILPLVLSGMAIAYRRNSYTWLFFSIAIIAQVMAFGKYTPIYRFMYEYLPAFSTFRVPKMIMFLTSFSVAVLAGIGANWLFFDEDDRKRERIKKAVYALIALLAISVIMALYAYIAREGLIQTYKADLSRAFRWKLPPDIAYRRFMNIIWGAVSFMAILGVTITFLWLCLKERISRAWLMTAATIFFVADVWSVNGRFIHTIPDLEVKKSEVVRFLEKDKDLFRVAAFAGEQSWYYVRYKISNISSYVAVSEKDYSEYLNRVELEGNLLDLMNVKYVTLKRAEIGDPPLGSILLGKYKVVFNNDPTIAVLENTKYLPRIYPVHNVIIENSKDSIFNILNHPNFNPRESVILEETPPSSLSPLPLSSSTSVATVSDYTGSKIIVEADMAENGFLVFSDKYYPGWKAYIDSKKTKIYKANYIMRAVYLPKGAHKVEFIFDPWPYKVGLWVSSTTFLFLIGAVVWRVRNVRRER